MARLIDADEAKEALTGWDTDPTDEEIEFTIDRLPTVDAVPVVHGLLKKSENCDEWYGYYYHCSECDTNFMLVDKCWNDIAPNFCPNCGAKVGGDV